jgi:YgiT-type zinc finger domain-containing protein
MCVYCKGQEFTQTLTTHVVNYKGRLIIIKNVPCEECVQCGEQYFSNAVARQLERLVQAAKQLAQELSVIDYSTAA